jgi:hypothetical protein
MRAIVLVAFLLLFGCAPDRVERADRPAVPDSTTANAFDPDTLSVGDRVLGLVVEDLRLQTAFDSTRVGSVTFAGEAQISGTLVRHPDSDLSAVCMDLDPASARRLPRWMGDTRRPWLCFSNDSLARTVLGARPIGSGVAVIIRRYQTVRSFSDAVDNAELVGVAPP